MSRKGFLSIALAGLLVVAPHSFALAYESSSSTNFQLSPNPYNMPAGNFSQPAVMTDEISLRGRLTAIPKGTIIMIKIDHPLSSSASKAGDPVSAMVEADVYLDNQIIIPAGSQIEGSVANASASGHLGRHGTIEILFHSIKTPNGYTLPLRAHVVTADETGIIKGDSDQAQVLKTLGVAVGGAAAGTLMGTAAGSILGSAGGGAAFGLAAGSLVGIGYAIARSGKDVVIPTGARMSIVLDQPVAMN